MVLYFDWELEDGYDANEYTEEAKMSHEEIKQFINQRYGVLDSEINEYEDINEPSFAVMSLTVESFNIKFFNIRSETLSKLNSCLSLDDLSYLTKKISDKLT